MNEISDTRETKRHAHAALTPPGFPTARGPVAQYDRKGRVERHGEVRRILGPLESPPDLRDTATPSANGGAP